MKEIQIFETVRKFYSLVPKLHIMFKIDLRKYIKY